MKLIKIDKVMDLTSIGRTKIYELIKGGEFPKQIDIGSRSSVWSETQVLDWIRVKVEQNQS